MIHKRVQKIGTEHCFISEITLAELKFGAENSSNPIHHRTVLSQFQQRFQIVPIFKTLDFYAAEKARLRKMGKAIDEFDLLIGATAVVYDYVMVTHNVSHLSRILNIEIEDWTQP